MASSRSARTERRLDPVTLEILWSRALSIADEVWMTIERTSFSTIVSAAHDFGAAVMDEEGNSLGQAYRSMPVFNITMPRVTKRLLQAVPKATIRPGDVFCTNDPWLCAGHVPDLAILTPVFADGNLVAWVGSICHEADMGGAHRSRAVRDVYEEGFTIPLLKMFDAGRPNETLFKLLRQNVRVPDMVLGDIDAQLAANELGSQRLLALMREYDMKDFLLLSSAISDRSEQAVRRTIKGLPDGDYKYVSMVDSSEKPFQIQVTIRIRGDEMWIDYSGTAGEAEAGGINCTLAYTESHSYYAAQYSLTPEVPNNEGCFKPIRVTAPEGCILNCRFPASVGSRSRTGWFIHNAFSGALAQASPKLVRAEHGFLHSILARGIYPSGEPYNSSLFMGAGQGAGWGQDGMSGWIFPSSASGVPVEVFEMNTPLWAAERRILPDTGGAGKFRGGPGYRVTVARRPDFKDPVRVWLNPSRMRAACEGFAGGMPGTPSRLLFNGTPPDPTHEWSRTGVFTFRNDDDRVSYDLPGGGGLGDPRQRDPELLSRDLRGGYVSQAGLAAYEAGPAETSNGKEASR